MTEVVTVRMEHCRRLRYCTRGIRGLFERYGLDYRDFLLNGIASDRLLEATKEDGMAAAAVEVARGEV